MFMSFAAACTEPASPTTSIESPPKRSRRASRASRTSRASLESTTSVASFDSSKFLESGYVELAAKMDPLVHELLVDNVDPAAFDQHELIKSISVMTFGVEGTQRDFTARSCRNVLEEPQVLSAEACKTLRDAVDSASFEESETADGLLEYGLSLSLPSLKALVGDEWTTLRALAANAYEELVLSEGSLKRDRLPHWDELGFAPPRTAFNDEPHAIFVRKYSAHTRPWLGFHTDRAELTVNVALSDDDAHAGGSLLAVVGNEVRKIERTQGAATIHSSMLVHAVTRMQSHTRYSLIIFFGNVCPAAQHRMLRCDGPILRLLFPDADPQGGCYCDLCGERCDVNSRAGEVEMYVCSEWCEYELCASCQQFSGCCGAP